MCASSLTKDEDGRDKLGFEFLDGPVTPKPEKIPVPRAKPKRRPPSARRNKPPGPKGGGGGGAAAARLGAEGAAGESLTHAGPGESPAFAFARPHAPLPAAIASAPRCGNRSDHRRVRHVVRRRSRHAIGLSAFLAGLRASFTSVFVLVLLGTYVGIAALAHDYGFSLGWVMVSTVLVWAGPSQVILISALGAGATLVETAIAVGLSCVRFLPMVVALLPLLRGPQTRTRDLLLPAHFTAASMWVESSACCRRCRASGASPTATGSASASCCRRYVGCVIGYFLTASLPPLLTAAMLFLTPMSFLVSTARNARSLADRLALALGLDRLPAAGLLPTSAST